MHLGLCLGQRAENLLGRLLDLRLQTALLDHSRHVGKPAVNVLMGVPVVMVMLVVMLMLVVMVMLVVMLVLVVMLMLMFMIVVMMMLMVVVAVNMIGRHVHMGAHHAVFELFLDVQVEGVAQIELGQVALEGFRIAARVEQRAHGHVSADAGKAVKIQDLHFSSSL